LQQAIRSSYRRTTLQTVEAAIIRIARIRLNCRTAG
jgi:hypothetical protein